MKSHYWADLTTEQLSGMPRDRMIAVLPIAATEQHGPHLPLSVDVDILNAVIEATLPKLPADLPAYFLPTQTIGKSNEHSRFAGTLTLSAQTLLQTWMEIGDCVKASGIRRLLIFNSHGGQMNLMDVATRDLRVRLDMLIVATSWYNLGLPAGLFSDEEMRHGIHGGDLETSVMLAAQPHKVRMDRARDFGSLTTELARDYKYLSITSTGKIGWQTQDLNPQGACGNAANATADRGRLVLDHVSDRFVELLREVQRAPLSLLRADPAWR